MKKRCTNSSCRKMFHYTVGDVAVCPYCKKVYARSINEDCVYCIFGDKKYSFKLLWSQESVFKFICSNYKFEQVNVIKHIRSITDISLIHGKMILDFIMKEKRVPVEVKLLREEKKVEKSDSNRPFSYLQEYRNICEANKMKVIRSVPVEAIPQLNDYRKKYEQIAKEGLKNVAKIEIDQLDLSVRGYNVLKRAGIQTVGDIMLMKREDVMKIRNMGKKTFEELMKKLEELNVFLD